MIWRALAAAVGALVLAWVVLLVLLWRASRTRPELREAARLLPDVLRLMARLARDRRTPRRARLGLWLVLGYLALPIDLVPDVIPVIGYADDAALVAIALRSVVRRAGPQPLRRHWPGSDEGLAVVARACGLGPVPD